MAGSPTAGFLLGVAAAAATLTGHAPGAGAVVGGIEADRAEFPFFATVGRGCGGTLVTPTRVLTAAHCEEILRTEATVRVSTGAIDVSVTAGPGRDSVRTGTGNDVVDAADGDFDTISCGAGIDRVLADEVDQVGADCELGP